MIKLLCIKFNNDKILFNERTKRICENCQKECLATLYCKYCVRNCLNNLIQNCQMETLRPDKIVEWISYNNLRNIKYLTKGGCSEIYMADWIDGQYEIWDNQEQQLKRCGKHEVILKRLENIEGADRSWLDEVKIFTNIFAEFFRENLIYL